jgi:hypothetical protein
MKKKYLLMLPAFSIATITPSWVHALEDVPAAAKVNADAEFAEAKPAKEMYDKLAAYITKKAKEVGEEVDGKAILEAMGFNDVTSYAMSSQKDGTEWKNLMFLHNGGSDKGIFSLFGKKDAEFSAPSMCPAGTDLVMQVDLDLRTVEALIRNVMKAANAPAEAQKEFEDDLNEEIPQLGMNASDMLAKMNVRLNIAIDLDDKVKLALPMVGELDKPHMVIRLDGLAWIWDKMGDKMIAESGMPLVKKEEGGVITYSLPPEMAAQFMGYLPLMSVDKNKDQIWIASSPDFLKRSMAGTETLAESIAYKATIQGLAQKGNAMGYMSKDFVDLLLQLSETAKEAGMMEQLGEAKPEIDKALADLKLIKQGSISTMSRTEDGILFTERGVKNLQERMKELDEAMKKMEEGLEGLKPQ